MLCAKTKIDALSVMLVPPSSEATKYCEEKIMGKFQVESKFQVIHSIHNKNSEEAKKKLCLMDKHEKSSF